VPCSTACRAWPADEQLKSQQSGTSMDKLLAASTRTSSAMFRAQDEPTTVDALILAVRTRHAHYTLVSASVSKCCTPMCPLAQHKQLRYTCKHPLGLPAITLRTHRRQVCDRIFVDV
jgi:hypothetical protein